MDDDLRLALQIEQGTELKLPSFSIPSMRRALENATEGDASEAEDHDLVERIGAEFERYWTATGRMTGKRNAAAKEVEEQRERVQALKEQMDSIEGDAAEMVRLAEEARGIAQTLQELAESERKLTEEWAGHRPDADGPGADRRRCTSPHRRSVSRLCRSISIGKR